MRKPARNHNFVSDTDREIRSRQPRRQHLSPGWLTLNRRTHQHGTPLLRIAPRAATLRAASSRGRTLTIAALRGLPCDSITRTLPACERPWQRVLLVRGPWETPIIYRTTARSCGVGVVDPCAASASLEAAFDSTHTRTAHSTSYAFSFLKELIDKCLH